jgi:(1->4)-alpha-D-glucan 1-alpha-D-glucosylmutase
VRSAREHGLGVVLDIVPNHMATDDANRWWADEELRAKFFDVDAETGRYRRFFDIDHLAGVRQEDPEVFETTHALALSLVREGVIDGLRVDHPDGLADPAGYFARLEAGGAQHVWVEKILDPGEPLRDWAVDGTVGYEFLNDVCALWVDPEGEEPLTAFWNEIAGDDRPFTEWADEAKLEQATKVFGAEVERLGRDAGRPVDGLAEAVASLSIYRTYVESAEGGVQSAEADREAIAEARGRGMSAEIADMLLREGPAEFVTRFQQTTPPVMAKGVEDTAFYRYARLIALNDVGGNPGRWHVPVEEFHAANVERASRFPRNLVTTMTHDAKRSHDVRARIAAISSGASEWTSLVRGWFEVNEPLRVEGRGPDRIEEYFVYQTLAGAWPIGADRVVEYVEKALREGKRNSNWISPDAEWEDGVKQFVRDLYEHPPFLETFQPFVERIAAAGSEAVLRQTALKFTVPGVPDIYNGDELEYFALVDPDNRRPVDWESRRALLESGDEPKQALIRALLRLRAAYGDAFAGSYEPVEAGPGTVAFVRGDELMVAVAIRGDLSFDAPSGWQPVLADWPGITVLRRQAR